MIKSWYLHVRDETMAPARMISFIEEHAISCDICRQDPDLKDEISKITEMVLPESKIPKAVRQKSSQDNEVDSDDDDDDVTSEDENEDEDNEEDDESSDEEGEDETEFDIDDEI